MDQLRFAITAVEGLVGVALFMVVGDYLGYKLGRMRLVSYVGMGLLIVIIAFAIYAAVVLA